MTARSLPPIIRYGADLALIGRPVVHEVLRNVQRVSSGPPMAGRYASRPRGSRVPRAPRSSRSAGRP